MIECNYSIQDSRTLFNIAIATKMLKPKMIVKYKRKAYSYDCGNVRITFDDNIQYSREVERFGRVEKYYNYWDEHDTILEVKYDEYIPSFIMQLLETNNMLQTSNSKYAKSCLMWR